MCGRYALACEPEKVAVRLSVATPVKFLPNTNAAPSQRLPVILNTSPNRMTLGTWGLEAPWKQGLIINARRESLETKRLFSDSFAKRRCLIPADAFYEWKKTGSRSIPHKFSLKDSNPFAFAGLWEGTPDNARFAIITVEPNDLVVKVHNRMPAIVRPGREKDWLAENFSAAKLLNQLTPFPATLMQVEPIQPLGRPR